jgi:glycosyltransferase involved in cell wall biosynthesis
MHFTIITPSFNQLSYLKRCISSIVDQVGPGAQRSALSYSDRRSSISVHHHIQDAGSSDGTVGFLKKFSANPPSLGNYQLSFASEADNGMYDALNKGIERVLELQKTEISGQTTEDASEPNNESRITNNCDDGVIAWLNCDEQYLPGTLKKVAAYFEKRRGVDFLYGDTLLVDQVGRLLTYRKNPPLRKVYIQSDHLYIQSSSLFFRQKIFKDGNRFDTRWKAVSDCDFIVRLLDAGFKAGRINDYLSIFTVSGANLSSTNAGSGELRQWRKDMPLLFRIFSLPLRAFRYLEKLLLGGYRERFPLEYVIYLDGNDTERTIIRAANGTSKFVGWSR